MNFVRALAKNPNDDEEHFHRLARDIVSSFRRLNHDEKIAHDIRRAYMISDEVGDSVGKSIEQIKNAASFYLSDDNVLCSTVNRLRLAIPGLMNFLIFEMMVDEGGTLRQLPEDVESALSRYYDATSLDTAHALLAACQNDPTRAMPWMADNLHRAIIFCELADDPKLKR